MPRFAVIDVETGGLYPHPSFFKVGGALQMVRPSGLTEVAAVVAEHSYDWQQLRVIERFSALIKPDEDNLTYDPRALEVQHRTLDDLYAHGIEESAALWKMHNAIQSAAGCKILDLPIWAHNASFDQAFIEQAYARVPASGGSPYNFRWRCSRVLYNVLGDIGVHSDKRVSLNAVMKRYNITMDADLRHTGAADSEATALCIGHMMRELVAYTGPAQRVMALV